VLCFIFLKIRKIDCTPIIHFISFLISFYFYRMKIINAIIMTIGDELLIGQVIDTNSSWMAKRLNEIGICVRKRIAIGDNENEIVDALDQEVNHADIILITGGLGPTSDDITKDVLCRYFNGKLLVNSEALQNVKHLFENIYKKPVTAINLKQAEVPDICTVIQNERGSAPGMVFKKGEALVISMPGVPYEMQGMMEKVLHFLENEFHTPTIIHKTILTSDIGESAIAELLVNFEKHLPDDIKLAYLPNHGMVRLRLSASGFDKVQINSMVNDQFNHMRKLVNDYVVTDVDETIEIVLGKLLLKNNKTISTAESCTGGAIAALITSVPGASVYYEGSVVSYSYAIKESMLGVKKDTLTTFGAVSEQTVIEMLQGVIGQLKTDFAIAVSGILGPGGGTDDKPVGTVWVAVGNKDRFKTQLFHLRYDRKKNTEVISTNAINMMRKFILEK
ncbi:MAG: CinA family nicotinamide mononucleotide deamidase-related protein, partial [Ginsengibacter sp.]